MKKAFILTTSNKSPERHLDSIKHEIKKYIARERRKSLPEDVDFWDFDCKIGNNEQETSTIHISEINSKIMNFATQNKESFYLEILAKPGIRAKNRMEKIAIFVDVQNIYYTVKDGLDGQFDYNTFWAKVVNSNCKVVAAYAYAIDRNDEKQIQFQNILRGIGFKVKLKPYISRSDGSSKGDWDVGITLDMLEISPSVDRLILLSGDGDFDLLVDNLISKNKKVDVYGVPQLTADSLKKSASNFKAIDQTFLIKKRGV